LLPNLGPEIPTDYEFVAFYSPENFSHVVVVANIRLREGETRYLIIRARNHGFWDFTAIYLPNITSECDVVNRNKIY